jgi:hypothetical protein
LVAGKILGATRAVSGVAAQSLICFLLTTAERERKIGSTILDDPEKLFFGVWVQPMDWRWTVIDLTGSQSYLYVTVLGL